MLKPRHKLLGAAICDRVAAGEGLTQICQGEGMPSPATFMGWTRQDTELGEQWSDARRALAQLKYEQVWDLVRDLDDAPGLKLKVDVLRWQATQAPATAKETRSAPEREKVVFKRAKL